MTFLQDNTQLANQLSRSLMLRNDGEGNWIEHGHVLMPEFSSNYIYSNGKHYEADYTNGRPSPLDVQPIYMAAPEVVTTARSNSSMSHRERSEPTPRKRSSTISCNPAPTSHTREPKFKKDFILPHLTPSDPNEFSDSSSSPSPALDQSAEWELSRSQTLPEISSYQSLARRPLPDLTPETVGNHFELERTRSQEPRLLPFKRNRSPTRVHTEGGRGTAKSRWPKLEPVSLDAGIPPEVPAHRTQSVSIASSWDAVLSGSIDQRRSPEFMPSGIYTRKCSYRATPVEKASPRPKVKLERSMSEAPRSKKAPSTLVQSQSTAAKDVCKPTQRFVLDGYQEGCALRVMNPDISDEECEDSVHEGVARPRHTGAQIIGSSTFCEVRRRESQQRPGQSNTYFVPSKAFLAEYDEDDDEFDFND